MIYTIASVSIGILLWMSCTLTFIWSHSSPFLTRISIFAGLGNTAPTAECDPGYYCPGGQSSSSPAGLECWEGHYCINGSAAPVFCVAGEYQPSTTQSECVSCPPGYYCDPNEGMMSCFFIFQGKVHVIIFLTAIKMLK